LFYAGLVTLQRAHQAGLWQDASIHGDLATPSLTEKIERIAAS
jgi:hypothetical protein